MNWVTWQNVGVGRIGCAWLVRRFVDQAPVFLFIPEDGREIVGPMAVIILGGLVTSTLLNLLVIPSLALRYGRFVGRRTQHSAPREGDRDAMGSGDLRKRSTLARTTTNDPTPSTEWEP